MAGRPGTLPWNFATFSGNEPVTTLSDNFNSLQGQINDSAAGATNLGTDTGTANNLVVTLPSAPLAYEAGFMMVVNPANTNTGPTVINVNGLGNVSVLHADGTALSGNEITAGIVTTMVYNGSAFLLSNASVATARTPGLMQAPYAGAVFFDDFITVNNWNPTTTGAGASFSGTTVTVDGTNKGFGVGQASTGTTTTGLSVAFAASPGGGSVVLFPGLGVCTIDIRVYLTALGTGAQNFKAFWGIADSNALTNSIVIGSSFSISSTNWVGQCNGGGATSTNGVAMTATAYHHLQIVINAAWTSVTFFADGAAVGTAITTNIPTVAMSPVVFVQKTAGTSAVGYFIDLYNISYNYAR